MSQLESHRPPHSWRPIRISRRREALLFTRTLPLSATMSSSKANKTLEAILAVTPHDEHEAVCAAWEALPPARQAYLATFPPAFVARWLRGELAAWDDDAPLNVLPEGGFARQVAFRTTTGGEVRLWCLVPSRSSTEGELIHCHDGVRAPAGTVVEIELTDDGFARAVERAVAD